MPVEMEMAGVEAREMLLRISGLYPAVAVPRAGLCWSVSVRCDHSYPALGTTLFLEQCVTVSDTQSPVLWGKFLWSGFSFILQHITVYLHHVQHLK